MKYVAWHNGQLLPDTILDNIIAAAKRGKITETGKDLLLVPDTRYGRLGDKNLKSMKYPKQHESVSLGRLFSHFKPA